MAKTRTLEPEAPQQNGAVAHDDVILERSTLPPPKANTEHWAEMPQDTYPGYRFRMWKNFPGGMLNKFQGATNAQVIELLQRIVLEHNGWPDVDGNVLPQPNDPAFFDGISLEQLGALIEAIVDESRKLPNSTMQPKRN